MGKFSDINKAFGAGSLFGLGIAGIIYVASEVRKIYKRCVAAEQATKRLYKEIDMKLCERGI